MLNYMVVFRAKWKNYLQEEFEAAHAFHLLLFLLASILPEKKKRTTLLFCPLNLQRDKFSCLYLKM